MDMDLDILMFCDNLKMDTVTNQHNPFSSYPSRLLLGNAECEKIVLATK